ncbi:MAG: hypothetical protein IM473_15670 [Microcystis sp. M015S2]|uniref:hypothetical protein n=1 Tax=unclassified Microcystis TaxID=2643300 RepID=UPI00258CD26E|nr:MULTISPECIES: hypothetical protein [unclassified Microcystis]MCA2708583.1 hypothetical protein [Microcystis sp. M025S2]MCA2743792.1 hypothetical protein [Microcystis sp. M015S2]MCA2759117.1 hypothetical protein [Microcystis sp. M145S2]
MLQNLAFSGNLLTIWLTDHPLPSAFYPKRDAITTPPDQKAIAITQKLLIPKMIDPRIPIPSNDNFKV